MSMERWTRVAVSEIKVGDTIKWWDTTVTVNDVATLSDGKAKFVVKYNDDRTEEMVLLLTNMANRLTMRKCNPCFDSDCECIYDQVQDQG